MSLPLIRPEGGRVYLVVEPDADMPDISQLVASPKEQHYLAVNCRRSKLLEDNWIRCRRHDTSVTSSDCRFCKDREPFDDSIPADSLMTVNATSGTAIERFILTQKDREVGAGMPPGLEVL